MTEGRHQAEVGVSPFNKRQVLIVRPTEHLPLPRQSGVGQNTAVRGQFGGREKLRLDIQAKWVTSQLQVGREAPGAAILGSLMGRVAMQGRCIVDPEQGSQALRFVSPA